MAKRAFCTVLFVFCGSLLLAMMCNRIASAFSTPISIAEGIGVAFIASLLYLIFLFIFTREKFIWQFILISMAILLFILLLAFIATNNIPISFSYFISGFIICLIVPSIAKSQAEEYKERKLMETISK